MEASSGVGCAIGPGFGAILYARTGYAGTFYVFGAINLTIAIVFWIILPDESKLKTAVN